jgi:Uma2 family endonuclease
VRLSTICLHRRRTSARYNCIRKPLLFSPEGDVVVEVLSPSTAGKDRKAKLRLYQRSGVHEYWIVDPVMRTVEVFHLHQNLFGPAETYAFGEDKFVPVGIRKGLHIALEDIFG